MSLAIGHFAVGVTGTCALLLLTRAYKRPRLPTALVVLIGGLWGMFPDIWRFTEVVSRSMHGSMWANICFGHQIIDQHIDPTDSHAVSVGFILLMVISILLVEGLRYRHHRVTHGVDDTSEQHLATQS